MNNLHAELNELMASRENDLNNNIHNNIIGDSFPNNIIGDDIIGNNITDNDNLDTIGINNINNINNIMFNRSNDIYLTRSEFENETINSVKSKFLSLLTTNISDNDISNDESLKSLEDKLAKINNDIMEVFTEFEKLQSNTIKLEKDYEISLENLKKDIEKLQKFQDFISCKTFKDDKKLLSSLTSNIEDICKNMLDNNEHENMRDLLHKNNITISMYLQKFIKPLNKGNIGSTCNFCMTNNVDSFINPCGHTGCKECLSRLEIDEAQCFICRNRVFNIKRLYF